MSWVFIVFIFCKEQVSTLESYVRGKYTKTYQGIVNLSRIGMVYQVIPSYAKLYGDLPVFQYENMHFIKKIGGYIILQKRG